MTKNSQPPNYDSFKVIACYLCKGDGVSYQKHTIDYRKGEVELRQHVCHLCEGSGLLTENTVVTYAPFKQSERWNNND